MIGILKRFSGHSNDLTAMQFCSVILKVTSRPISKYYTVGQQVVALTEDQTRVNCKTYFKSGLSMSRKLQY